MLSNEDFDAVAQTPEWARRTPISHGVNHLTIMRRQLLAGFDFLLLSKILTPNRALPNLDPLLCFFEYRRSSVGHRSSSSISTLKSIALMIDEPMLNEGSKL